MTDVCDTSGRKATADARPMVADLLARRIDQPASRNMLRAMTICWIWLVPS
jgi:hypothetical protein